MDITGLIAAATSGVERPDFTMDNPWFAMQVQHAIAMSHSLGWFEEDLTSSGKLPVGQNVSSCEFAPTGLFRALKDISLFDSLGNQIELCEPFKRGTYRKTPKDYFDYPAQYFYYVFGNSITARFPATATPQQIEFLYYRTPQVTYDAATEQYICDSFILRQFPALIIYDLMRAIATITSSDQERALIQQYNEAMLQFMGDRNVR